MLPPPVLPFQSFHM